MANDERRTRSVPASSKAQQRPATISDVAQAAGVSPGTVSHVLTNARNVAPATRARVEAAVADLGYRPNRAARSLARDRTDMVGVLIPDITNPYFGELARGAEDELAKDGLNAVIGNTDNQASKEESYLRSFAELRLDGIIVAAASTTLRAGGLRDMRLPSVLVDRRVYRWSGDTVFGDDDASMRIAVDHLAEMGHRDIIFVAGNLRLPTPKARGEAFAREAQRRGLHVWEAITGPLTAGSLHEEMVEALRRHAAVTAVVTSNDVQAMAVLAAAGSLGLEVPKDLSVLGHDDIKLARLTQPGLTTVAQPAYEMGAEAARILIARMKDPDRRRVNLVLEPRLVVRDSTSAASNSRRYAAP